jgi:8-oxo-dGTP pyrophosphatase MutT (NUDIX family)
LSTEDKKSPPFYASVAIMNPKGEILLGKRKDNGIYTMPGGGGHELETPEKAAVREAFEESGVPINPLFLVKLPSIETRNGKLCHCFLYHCGMDIITTSKLDPDHEVGTWKWFSHDKLPNTIHEDPRRFESVRNAFMAYHGITKSLTDKLFKGGKPATIGERRIYGGIEHQKMGDGTWKPVPKPQDKDGKEKDVVMHPMKQHLNDMKSQAIVEGKTLRSDKPVFTNVEAAIAHGYEVQDFKEAGAFFYDRSQQMSQNIEKLEKLKQKVDPSMKKIAHENMRMARQFTNQGNHLDDRRAKTAKDIKSGAAVQKAVVMMGQQDGAEIDTAKFAVENKISHESGWYEKIHQAMEGYSAGDVPRVIFLSTNYDLHLVKVDDGMYSGVVKKFTNAADEWDADMSPMVENAKIRIERMTIPSLVQFLMAKEYIQPESHQEPEMMPEPIVESLVSKLEVPAIPEDRTITILTLLSKLISKVWYNLSKKSLLGARNE